MSASHFRRACLIVVADGRDCCPGWNPRTAIRQVRRRRLRRSASLRRSAEPASSPPFTSSRKSRCRLASCSLPCSSSSTAKRSARWTMVRRTPSTWTDDNPFEQREIQVQATASNGAVLSDSIVLPPYEVAERAQVTGVLLETSVYDRLGRFAVAFDTVGVHGARKRRAAEDRSWSRERRCRPISCCWSTTARACRDAWNSSAPPPNAWPRACAERTASSSRRSPRTSARSPGRPTIAQTVTQAISSMRAGGGTALLDSLLEATRLLQGSEGRRAIVLITDGYDENSTATADEVVQEPSRNHRSPSTRWRSAASPGISLRGEDLLRRFADRIRRPRVLPAARSGSRESRGAGRDRRAQPLPDHLHAVESARGRNVARDVGRSARGIQGANARRIFCAEAAADSSAHRVHGQGFLSFSTSA